jgi:hypothetical protein
VVPYILGVSFIPECEYLALNNKFVTKNIWFAGITSVADPCAPHVLFHALKNAYN